MKYKISDLLDNMPAEDIQLEENSPLSPKRIRDMTMKKVVGSRPNKMKRLGFRVLVAAAILSSLAMTVVAGEYFAGDFFPEVIYYRRSAENVVEVREPLSPEQMALISDAGAVFEQSVTSQGTTFTALAGYGDENRFVLRLRVEAPQGTVLPDGIQYAFDDGNTPQPTRDIPGYDTNAHRQPLVTREDAYKNTKFYQTVQTLPDEDPGDNVKEFLVYLTRSRESSLRFNDGVSKLLTFYGLWETRIEQKGDEYTEEFKRLLPGEFTFDIGLANEIPMISLDVEGLRYESQLPRDPTGEEVSPEKLRYTIVPTLLKISPLSIELEYKYSGAYQEDPFVVDLEVVLKNGEKAPVSQGYRWKEFIGKKTGGFIGTFVTPTDLAQVDYILIGGAHKVYLPKEDLR